MCGLIRISSSSGQTVHLSMSVECLLMRSLQQDSFGVHLCTAGKLMQLRIMLGGLNALAVPGRCEPCFCDVV
jgi:hypothetical protein